MKSLLILLAVFASGPSQAAFRKTLEHQSGANMSHWRVIDMQRKSSDCMTVVLNGYVNKSAFTDGKQPIIQKSAEVCGLTSQISALASAAESQVLQMNNFDGLDFTSSSAD